MLPKIRHKIINAPEDKEFATHVVGRFIMEKFATRNTSKKIRWRDELPEGTEDELELMQLKKVDRINTKTKEYTKVKEKSNRRKNESPTDTGSPIFFLPENTLKQ